MRQRGFFGVFLSFSLIWWLLLCSLGNIETHIRKCVCSPVVNSDWLHPQRSEQLGSKFKNFECMHKKLTLTTFTTMRKHVYKLLMIYTEQLLLCITHNNVKREDNFWWNHSQIIYIFNTRRGLQVDIILRC